MRALWLIFGFIALALAGVGLFLPIMPTVPFLLLATFCFARSSRRLYRWMIGHPRFGPSIVAWRERGAIGLASKRVATLSILAGFGVSVVLGFHPAILVTQAVILAGVSWFIWSRPDA